MSAADAPRFTFKDRVEQMMNHDNDSSLPPVSSFGGPVDVLPEGGELVVDDRKADDPGVPMTPVDVIRALQQLEERFLHRSIPSPSAELDWKQCRFCLAYIDWPKFDSEPRLCHSKECPADALDPIRAALEAENVTLRKRLAEYGQ